MPNAKPPPSSYFSDIDWPRCPKCHEPRMRYSKTEAGPPSFEYRIFDCQKCHRTHTMIISRDPRESNVRGWLSGRTRSTEVSGGPTQNKRSTMYGLPFADESDCD